MDRIAKTSEMSARDKHFSLLQTFVNKKIYNMGPKSFWRLDRFWYTTNKKVWHDCCFFQFFSSEFYCVYLLNTDLCRHIALAYRKHICKHNWIFIESFSSILYFILKREICKRPKIPEGKIKRLSFYCRGIYGQ